MFSAADPAAIRDRLYTQVLDAASNLPDVVGPTHTLRLTDVGFAEEDPQPDKRAEKQALMSRSSLGRRIRGTWSLVDNVTGDTIDTKRQVVAQVPAILQDGSFIHKGTRYAMGVQQRLRPGVYIRHKKNGEAEAFLNAKPKTGSSHRYVLQPETGVFHVNVGHAKIPLVPLLETLGATREQIEEAWGKEIAQANYAKKDPKSLQKLFDRFVSSKDKKGVATDDVEQVREKIRESMAKVELDPSVTRRTLGIEATNLNPEVILRATKRTLGLLQRGEDADDRDHPAFASYHTAADIFSERIKNDYDRIRQQLLHKAARKQSLSNVPSGALNKQIDAAIFRSGLAQTLEGINPLETLNLLTKVTRYGEGGLPGTTATPDEARNVNPGQFGFIDSVSTPESQKVGVDGFLARNAVLGSDNNLYSRVIDNKTGEQVYRSTGDVMDATMSLGKSPVPGRELAVRKGKLALIKEGTAEYKLPHFEWSFGEASGLVPMKSAMFGQRASMAMRMSVSGDSKIIVQRADGGGYFGPIADYEWQDGDQSLSIDKTTHEMCWKPVKAKLTHKNTKRLLRVTTKSGRSVVATEDHSFVTLSEFGQLEKIKTEQLEKYSPIPSGPVFDVAETFKLPLVVSGGKKHNAWPARRFELDRDLGWIVGLWVSEGYGNYRKDIPEGVAVTFANINKEIQERSKAFFDRYGIDAFVRSGRPDGLSDRIKVNWKQLLLTLRHEFGDGAYNKKLPGWVMFAPREFREGVLAGYLDGDGIVSAPKNRSVSVGGGSRSEALRDALAALCGTLGIATTVSEAWVNTGPGGSRVRQFKFNVRKEHIGRLPKFTYPVKELKRDAAEWSGKRSGDWLPLFEAARLFFRRFTKRGTTAYKRADQHKMGTLSRAEIKDVLGEQANWLTRGWADSKVWWDRTYKTYELSPEETAEHEYVYDLDMADNVFWVNGLFVHNSSQAIALDEPEAPLVQTGVPGAKGEKSFEDLLGERMGAVRAQQPGRVIEVDDDYITVKYQGGKTSKISLDNNLPGARKTVYHQTPLVKVGQEFGAGDLLAKGNHTDANGTTAIGRNLRTALVHLGDNWEDAIVISKSAARKMRIQQAYKHMLEPGEGLEVNKKKFIASMGNKFGREQFDALDDDGVVKVGTRVNRGDPLVLALSDRGAKAGRVHRQGKQNFGDASILWDHNHSGVVTDVMKTPKGMQVVVKSGKELEEGDKISARQGNKGVVRIVDDSQMPTDENGDPIEAAISPLAVVSRGNASFPLEMALAKVAQKLGKPFKFEDFGEDTNIAEYVRDKLREHDVKDTETLTDPETGRKIKDVLTGPLYLMALHHTSESKGSARGLGAYAADGTPAKGSHGKAKRASGQELYAALSHGAYNLSRENSLIRGQRNDDYWQAFMSGQDIGEPQVPAQYEGFVQRLQAMGVNPLRRGTKTQLMAMTDKDIEKLAGGREVTVADTVDVFKDLAPVKGGLFDEKLFGDGDKWAYISLPEPIPNPVFEEPLRKMLGLTEKQLRGVMAGTEDLPGHGTGIDGLQSRLKSMDLDSEIRKAREDIASTKKTARDKAVKRLGYLKALKSQGMRMEDLLISKIPVLPPRMRPISKMRGRGNVLVNDMNFLYKELMQSADLLEQLKGVHDDVGAERLAVYDAQKALVGMADPASRELKQRKVKGLLKTITGSSPKTSYMQRKLVSGTVDTVGRGVITVDKSLNMDEVGVPESIAFESYQPYVVRNLVQRGIPRTEALRHAKDRTDVAREALVVEMKHRPVVMSRAPILHKRGVLGLTPRLVRGDVIKLNPLVYKGLGADNDGDAMNIHVPHSRRVVDEVKERMLPSKMLISEQDFVTPAAMPTQDYLLGLFQAADKKSSKKTRYFATLDEAKAAWRRGDIDINDPVRIADRR